MAADANAPSTAPYVHAIGGSFTIDHSPLRSRRGERRDRERPHSGAGVLQLPALGRDPLGSRRDPPPRSTASRTPVHPGNNPPKQARIELAGAWLALSSPRRAWSCPAYRRRAVVYGWGGGLARSRLMRRSSASPSATTTRPRTTTASTAKVKPTIVVASDQ